MRKRRREERAGEMTASSAEARVDVRGIRRDVHEHQLGPLIEDAVSGGDEAERSVLKLYRAFHGLSGDSCLNLRHETKELLIVEQLMPDRTSQHLAGGPRFPTVAKRPAALRRRGVSQARQERVQEHCPGSLSMRQRRSSRLKPRSFWVRSTSWSVYGFASQVKKPSESHSSGTPVASAVSTTVRRSGLS